MAVELDRLYKEIQFKYNVHLQTTSCFDKKISWLHILENIEFAQFLHGDELVFNASLNYATLEERKDYIDQLLISNAGGLIVSLQEDNPLQQTLIAYCNEKKFPLLTTDWETPFINITRIFSEILIDNERAGMDLIAAFKNAIHYPQDRSLYFPHFEKKFFPAEADYNISILNTMDSDTSSYEIVLKKIELALQPEAMPYVAFKDSDMIITLSCNISAARLNAIFSEITDVFSNLRVGIGSSESHLSEIHRSYKNAQHALRLCGNVFSENPLSYDSLGIYQILADIKDPEIICPAFVEHTLGKLIAYDEKHHTDYLSVLSDFFENDCSITQTANATFFHQNTLKYKIKNIKEILGYDITRNEHRAQIIIALCILKVQNTMG